MPRDMVERSLTAPPEHVWALLSDFGSWPRWWAAWPATAPLVDAEGDATPGAVRRGRHGDGVLVEERVTEAAAGALLAVEATVDAGPVRAYESTIALAPGADGGTRVRWEHRFLLRGVHVLFGPVHRARLRASKVQALDALNRVPARRPA